MRCGGVFVGGSQGRGRVSISLLCPPPTITVCVPLPNVYAGQIMQRDKRGLLHVDSGREMWGVFFFYLNRQTRNRFCTSLK